MTFFGLLGGTPPLGPQKGGLPPLNGLFGLLGGVTPPLWDPYKGGILQKADAYFLK